jgi:hypothetical protein
VASPLLCAGPACSIPITGVSLTDTFCSHTCARAWEIANGAPDEPPADGGTMRFPYGTRGPGISTNDGNHALVFAFSWLDVRIRPGDPA